MKRLINTSVLGGLIFAILTGFGVSLDRYGSVWKMTTIQYTCIVWPVAMVAVGLFLMYAPKLFQKKIERTFQRKYFYLIWGLIFLCWIPTWLASFPGIFAYDTAMQIKWFSNGEITGHHPLLHTVYLGGCVAFGRTFFNSDVVGACLYVVSQMLMLSALFAGISSFLMKWKTSIVLFWGSLFFWIIYPTNSLMAICSTKDVLFGGVFGLLLCLLIELLKNPEVFLKSRKNQVILGVLLFLNFALRNNALHTFLISAPILILVLRTYWKKIVPIFFISFVCYFIYTGPIYAMLGVGQGDDREMYSVIMQQVGRMYEFAREDITEEEYEDISYVIPQRGLERYEPLISDPVKDFFLTENFNEDKPRFLKAWVSMGLRNPKLYVDSFFMNTYGFWYPMETLGTIENKRYMEYECYTPWEDSFFVEMEPKILWLHECYQKLATGEFQENHPVLGIFISTAFSFWILLLCSIWVTYKKNYRRLFMLLPLYAYFFTVLLGPIALTRYVYAMIVSIPLMIYIGSEGEEDYEKPLGKL